MDSGPTSTPCSEALGPDHPWPAPAQPIEAGWVELAVAAAAAVAATPMPAWWARPAARPPRGLVLVLPEVFGVNAWVRSVADRLAGEGYAALAISTFARTAPHLELGYDAAGLAAGREHRDQVTAQQLLADAAAACAWLRQAHAADGLAQAPLGCVGFCFGGHLALIAATLPAITATAAFYGARVASFQPGMEAAPVGSLRAQPSLALVPQISGRLWCFCGDADPLIPAAEVEAIAATLTAANGGVSALEPQARHRLIQAHGAGHGYLCEARSDFHPAAARAGWAHLLQLFDQSLDASGQG